MQQPDAAVDQETASPKRVVLDSHGEQTWKAMRETVAWFELAQLNWTFFSGGKAAEALNGLLTNDVAMLSDRYGLYAAALTPKGKVAADMVVLRDSEQSLLVGVSAMAFDAWWQIVRKYVNPRLARYSDERSALVSFVCIGPDAARVLRSADASNEAIEGEVRDPSLLAAWQHSMTSVAGVQVRVAHIPVLHGFECFLVVAPVAARDQLLEHFGRGGAMGSLLALELARIQSGRPLWGVDMDDNSLAQEAILDDLQAISFDKGCYTGQETVARVHFRGHVNRYLRGLRSASPLAPRSEVLDETGKLVGNVRSAAQAPDFGSIAIAMIRREVPDGARVRVDGQDATVEPLPFR